MNEDPLDPRPTLHYETPPRDQPTAASMLTALAGAILVAMVLVGVGGVFVGALLAVIALVDGNTTMLRRAVVGIVAGLLIAVLLGRHAFKRVRWRG